MAGNPFRKSGVAFPSGGPVSERRAAADLSIVASDTILKPKKVVKRVRIQSPVISPDEPEEDPFDAKLNDIGHPGSPPPPDQESDVAAELRKSFIDSVARGASNLNRDAVGDAPPQAQRVGLGTDTMASSVAPQQAPYNPFAWTLASIEGGYGLTTPAVSSADTTGAGAALDGQAGLSVQGTGKAAMDVDSFTRMLLTGSTSAAAPSAPPAIVPLASVEVTSTENSSISRQSVFEPVHDLHAESPRSSYEDSASDDTADMTEHSSLVGEPHSKKSKPPPPAHHRGKLLSRKGPQTVSFADFETSSPSSGQLTPALPSPSLSRPAPGRSLSDLNKPLPPPPGADLPAPNVPEEGVDTKALHSLSEVQNEMPPAKARPPPPISRRSSLKIDGPTSRRRSNSSLSKSSVADYIDESSPTIQPRSSQSQLQLQPSKPPPPPARRVANSSSLAERDTSSPVGVSVPSQFLSKPPPPPSRRNAPGLTRSPSTQSTSSIGHRRISPSLSQAPPPPPPPRRTDKRSSFDGTSLGTRRPSDGSQRSSIELRRSSGASFNHARTPSISSLQNVPEGEADQDYATREPSQQDNSKDILADLSAFQAEIDALRAQIGK